MYLFICQHSEKMQTVKFVENKICFCCKNVFLFVYYISVVFHPQPLSKRKEKDCLFNLIKITPHAFSPLLICHSMGNQRKPHQGLYASDIMSNL